MMMINVFGAANQHIKMISEESCDSEDWSNDAENSALATGINYILKFTFTLSFSRHFYPKRLTNEDNGSNQNQQKINDMQVL